MTAEASAPQAREAPRTPDGYSAVEAARVIGVSERRIRQLADAGRLPTVNSPDSPLRVDQEAVHRMREERRAEQRKEEQGLRRDAAEAPPSFDPEALVARVLDRMLPRMLESSERAEESARALAHEERARARQLEEQLVEERVARRLAEERLADLERRNATEPSAVTPPEEAAEGSGRRRTWWGKRID